MSLARSKKIRDSANGKDCTLRLYPICNGNPETTVFAHIGKNRGVSIKCGDNMGIYVCSSCHDIIDGRIRRDMTQGDMAIDKLRALEETQQILIEEGLMVIL